MKISELTTERAADVLCEITPLFYNIASDTSLTGVFREKLPEDAIMADVYAIRAKYLCGIVPILLKTHREDVFGILAALNGVTVKDIAAQKLTETLKQAEEAIKDKDLRAFFDSLRHTEGGE